MFLIMVKSLYLVLSIVFMTIMSVSQAQNAFVKVKGHEFWRNNKPYRYAGANYWYGGLLSATKGEAGKIRLQQELDFLKSKGINNLRVLVGAEGKPGNYTFSVAEASQPEQGKFDDNLLKGLDYFLQQIGKRNMTAILFLTNNWEWSGGLGQYLQWNGYGQQPLPHTDDYTWDKSKAYITQFYTCENCKTALNKYIGHILQRVNAYTGKPYINDPAIMAWELANEPRPMSQANNGAYLQWINQTATYIKSVDKNHLVTTGSEGAIASDMDIAVYERAHSGKNIDYLTIHIWPRNWGWFKGPGDMPGAMDKTKAYIERHISTAEKLNKPLVIEEFGLTRDGDAFSPETPTALRDQYYDLVFSFWKVSGQKKGVINGINFWAVNGIAKPKPGQAFWQPGDDYMGDPPQEEQGLYGVYNTDASTWKVITSYSKPALSKR
jgi:mannan endo-1,4-beta-mannosidase